jgi:hypothetical protein
MIEEIVKELSSDSEEGYVGSIYDDTTGKIVAKNTPIDEEGKLPSGGNPTIGTGHLVTKDEYESTYKTGKIYSKTKLDEVLYNDVLKKQKIVEDKIKKDYADREVSDDVKKLLIKTTFWLDAPNKFPMFFDGMVTGDYEKAKNNLIYTDPSAPEMGNTKIYDPPEGMSGLKERTLKYIEAINQLKINSTR